jgi:O-methyltransferase
MFGEEARFELLRKVGRWIMPAYRFHWPQLYWWRDKEFNDFLSRFGELHGNNSDRRWMLYQMALLAQHVPGDTAECGAYQGAGSFLISKATQQNGLPRTHYIFDSFEGISEPSAADGGYWRKGNLRCSLEDFREPPGNFSIKKGWIPERFPEVSACRFAFVHIDVDLEKPTLESLSFFYPRMNPGGIMVFDDYGFTTCPGARQAVAGFMADKAERIVELSCGSAYISKA